jgi:hypothetical protein
VGVNEIIEARIRKYTADISGAYDGCECPSCVGARHVLKEYDYLKMALRNLASRAAVTAGDSHTTSTRRT